MKRVRCEFCKLESYTASPDMVRCGCGRRQLTVIPDHSYRVTVKMNKAGLFPYRRFFIL